MIRLIAFFILVTTSIQAQTTIDLGNSQRTGKITLFSQGGIEFESRPVNRVQPAPHRLDPQPADQQMALQSMAIALVMNNTRQRYTWYNRSTRNGGGTIIHGQIDGVPRGCTGLEVVLHPHGQPEHREWMVACRGGGSSNTWIIDRKWIISSVSRTKMDHQGCVVRFVDPKIPDTPRAASTQRVCRQGNTWNVGG